MSNLSNQSPALQLLGLFAFIIGGFLLVSLATAGIMLVFDIPFAAFETVDDTFYANMNGLKVIQIISQICMFVIPALGFAYVYSKKPFQFLGLTKKNTTNQWIWGTQLCLFSILFSMPLLFFALKLNMQMQLPEAFASLETWMRQSEDQLAEMTAAFLEMNNFGDFLFNLLVVAVVPAIAEELLFRGALQQTLQKLFNNPHIAILVTGIIFSAIHAQFYGFIPRMLIGMYLGYLFYWSGSLWFPIIGHFINNGIQVLFVYAGLVDVNEAANAPEQDVPFYAAIISIVLLTVVAVLFRKLFIEEKERTELGMNL